MKTLKNIVLYTLLLIGLYYLIKFSIAKELTKILASLCVPILVIVPRILKDKINDKLVIMYYFYIFILLILGCLTDLYSKLDYYDVFAHFMFGFASSITAVYFLNLFKVRDNNIFNIIFIISLTLCLGSMWEIFEYISSIITKDDIQHVLTTGVKDTMEDIIVSLIASIVFAITYIFEKDKINKFVK